MLWAVIIEFKLTLPSYFKGLYPSSRITFHLPNP